MKHAYKALAAGVALAVSASAQANSLGPDEVAVAIQTKASSTSAWGESMLINTGLLFDDFVAGTVAPWTSSAALTAEIFGFIDGAFDVRAYAFGADNQQFYDRTLSTSNAIDTALEAEGAGAAWTIFEETVDLANSAFGADGANDGSTTGIPAGDAAHFENSIWGQGVVGGGFGIGEATTFYYSIADGFNLAGGTQYNVALNDWNLAADGTLSYVPLPAAVWMLGAGLVALVGLGRRKAA